MPPCLRTDYLPGSLRHINPKTNSSGTIGYTWDYENRLTSVTLPGGGGRLLSSMIRSGRRIQKSGPAGTTNYLYDGANVVTDLDVNGAVLARYTQGAGIDEPLASLTALGTAFFEADGLGSITSLSGASGITDRYTYKPFGITTATGSNPNRFRFTGREWDSETNLYYYRARYYDPAVGRFSSDDPIRFSAGPNFYAYVGNNPTGVGDPTGLLPPERHYNLTYELAKKAFGPKCESRARKIAEANKEQDALPTVGAKVKFVLGLGDPWRQGSIHFGGPVDQLLQNAFSSCDDNILGKALHGLQDDLSHSGAYARPWIHYVTSLYYFPYSRLTIQELRSTTRSQTILLRFLSSTAASARGAVNEKGSQSCFASVGISDICRWRL